MWHLIAGTLALPSALILGAQLGGHPVGPWTAVHLLVFPAVLAASIAIHELGHALAARALGLHVGRVEIGVGRRLARWRLGVTSLYLNAFPIVGLTFMGAHDLRWLRTRLWLSVSAGPLVTLALAATAAAYVPGTLRQAAFPVEAIGSRFALVELFAFANAWLLGINLLPFAKLGGIGIATDGSQLVKLPTVSTRELRELIVVPAALEALEHLEADELDAAEQSLEPARRAMPDSWTIRNTLAVIALERDQLEHARAEFLDLLATLARPELGWILRNNIAWVDFRLRSDALRAEADELSQLALDAARGSPSALGTRGAVLGWLGRHREAVALLDRAYTSHGARPSRANIACLLAISHAALGERGAAGRWLERARADHPGCRLLPDAEVAVTAGAEGAGSGEAGRAADKMDGREDP